jgi:hypothetical protein
MAEAAEFVPEADTLDADLDAMRDEDRAVAESDDAPAAEPVQAEPQETETQRHIRSLRAALKEERRARQQLEQKVQPPQTASAAFQAMLEGAPDENVDPIGFMNHMRKAVQRLDDQQKADFEAQQQQTQRQGQIQQLTRTVQEYEADFRADHPDYDAAMKHFAEARSAELATTGLTGQALNNALAQDVLGLAMRCLNASKDPAEVVYALAQRAGYKPSKSAAGNVSAVDPASERLDQIAKGQQQARSLSVGGSTPGGGALTYEAVNKLDGAAFDSAFDKLRRQERRRA